MMRGSWLLAATSLAAVGLAKSGAVAKFSTQMLLFAV